MNLRSASLATALLATVVVFRSLRPLTHNGVADGVGAAVLEQG